MNNERLMPKLKLSAIRLFNFNEWMNPSEIRNSLIFNWGSNRDKNLNNFYKYIYNLDKHNKLSQDDKKRLYQFFITLEEDAQRSTIKYDGVILNNQYFFGTVFDDNKASGILRTKKRRVKRKKYSRSRKRKRSQKRRSKLR